MDQGLWEGKDGALWVTAASPASPSVRQVVRKWIKGESLRFLRVWEEGQVLALWH